ncbi:hypothetical protein OK016_02585 [Vibrio chagasii]|nr:hypothetical protein [Vibrio chagasii]
MLRADRPILQWYMETSLNRLIQESTQLKAVDPEQYKPGYNAWHGIMPELTPEQREREPKKSRLALIMLDAPLKLQDVRRWVAKPILIGDLRGYRPEYSVPNVNLNTNRYCFK